MRIAVAVAVAVAEMEHVGLSIASVLIRMQIVTAVGFLSDMGNTGNGCHDALSDNISDKTYASNLFKRS